MMMGHDPFTTAVDPAVVVEEASQLLALLQEPGWGILQKLIQQIIEAETPTVTGLTSSEQALNIASKLTYVSGLKRLFVVVNQQREILRALDPEHPMLLLA